MRFLPILLASTVALPACGRHVTFQGNEPLDFNTSAYLAPSETVRMPDREMVLLYRKALSFYRPGRGNARWLDRAMLPSDPAAPAGRTLDSSLAVSIVEQLEGAFCLLNEAAECDGKSSGGTLRVSPVYQVDAAQARVIVEFQARDRYGPAFSNTMAFLMVRNHDGWHILSRGPAKDRS
jgi:hypothetical protein